MEVQLYDRNHGAPDTKNHESHAYEQEVLTPPFVANAVRMAALYHIERIRKLTPEDRNSAHYNTMDAGPTAEKDRQARQRMVRGMLMSDISKLSKKIQALEESLTEERNRDLLYQISSVSMIAPLGPIFLGKNFVSNVGLLFVGTFITHAIYSVHKNWRTASYTRLVREGLQRLEDRAKGEESFGDSDTECLEEEIWSQVPWKGVEDC